MNYHYEYNQAVYNNNV